jgi:alpha/beta hydrolase family protein
MYLRNKQFREGNEMEKKYFESFDGLQIPYLLFESKRDDAKNNVIIFHGMTEPVTRYEEFGEFLAANGYNVYVMEIRGHGDLKDSEIGDFGKKGIKNVYSDVDMFLEHLSQYGVSSENTVIFGHSMGSLMATKIGIEKDFKYFILSGWPVKPKIPVWSASVVSFFEKLLFFRKKSTFNKIFIGYNKSFAPNKSKVDWLTRDEMEAKKYEQDEFCGYAVSPKFFSGIFQMMRIINRKYKRINKDSKILVVYGTEDRALNYGYINKLLKNLRKNKIKIGVLENKDGRHESLNEINKHKIYDEILEWLNSKDK